MSQWPPVSSLLKTDVHLAGVAFVLFPGHERKRNTGLLKMESYAAVLNISVFLGPDLTRVTLFQQRFQQKGESARERRGVRL